MGAGEDRLKNHLGCEGLEVTGVLGSGDSRGVQSSRPGVLVVVSGSYLV